MKSIILFLVYIATFMGMFFVLSFIGFLWYPSYTQIISNHNWFIGYGFAIGSWLSVFPTIEYYSKNEKYFETLFGNTETD